MWPNFLYPPFLLEKNNAKKKTETIRYWNFITLYYCVLRSPFVPLLCRCCRSPMESTWKFLLQVLLQFCRVICKKPTYFTSLSLSRALCLFFNLFGPFLIAMCLQEGPMLFSDFEDDILISSTGTYINGRTCLEY